MEKIRETKHRFKIWLTAVLAVLLLIFVVQNSGAYKIKFLIWQRSISLSLALIAVGVAGFIIGLLWGLRKARKS